MQAALRQCGVGTGLALPSYKSGKRVAGIDLSGEMLAKAETIEGLGMTPAVIARLERSIDAALARCKQTS